MKNALKKCAWEKKRGQQTEAGTQQKLHREIDDAYIFEVIPVHEGLHRGFAFFDFGDDADLWRQSRGREKIEIGETWYADTAAPFDA